MKDLSDRLAALTPGQRALFETRLRERGLTAPRPRSIRPIPDRERLAHLPTSLDQERLWFIDQMEPGHAAYNIPTASRLLGPLDPELMHRAVNATIARHEVLRTTFHAVDGRPVQVVAPKLEIDVPLLDLTQLPQPEREAAAIRFAVDAVSDGFDLAHGPLVRVRLARVQPEEHVMAICMHHIVTDRFSFDIFETEVARIYVALRDGGEPDLPPLPIQFADFAAWQREEMSGERLERHVAHWRETMAGAPLVLEIPADRPRPPIQTFAGAREYIVYPDSALTALKELARAEGATMFMTVLAALDVLCWKWSGERDFIVGSAIADRNRPETENLVGYFLNMLLLRARIDPAMSFRQLVRQARETALGAFAHQDVPFATLVGELKPRPDPSRNPLIQVSFIYLDFPDYAIAEHAGLTSSSLDVDNGAARFDLTLACTELPGTGIHAYFEYCTDLYGPERVQRLLRQLGRIFDEVTSAPDRPLREIDIRTDEECQSLARFNETSRSFGDVTLQDLLARAAAASSPGARVVIDGVTTDFHALDEAAARLATLLGPAEMPGTVSAFDAPAGVVTPGILGSMSGHDAHAGTIGRQSPTGTHDASAGMGVPNKLGTFGAAGTTDAHGATAATRTFTVPVDVRPSLIGVCAARSLEQVVALLAVIKAGGAYVPLDPSLPAARLEAILAEARPAAVLAPRNLFEALAPTGARLIAIEEAWKPPASDAHPLATDAHGGDPHNGIAGNGASRTPGRAIDADRERTRSRPDELAYVMFTSGSTGAPKGVMVSHRAIVNRLLWAQERYPIRPDDRVLHNASFAFDIAAWELFGPLAAGATVVIPREGEHKDPIALARLIAEQSVTVAHFVPTMLRQILQEPSFRESARTLRAVLCGGEEMERDLYDRFFEVLPGRTLAHFYGPTEAAISCLYHDCTPGLAPGPVPIGGPIANLRVHLLDRDMRPVPAGAAGEIVIGGAGLALGYLGRSDLTAERFVPDPVSGIPGERLYRTGDLARFRADGGLEFLGRTDNQVKIRGYRIEPAEIEGALERLPGIASAVVIARGEGTDRRLAAYIVPGGDLPEEAVLRAALRRTLPEPMIPAAFVVLDAMPLGPNGKVDRRALPEPGASSATGATFVEPRTPAEETIASIWAGLLRRERIGVLENFFDLGGDSLLATQVVSRMRAAFDIEFPLRRFFEGSTVASLAAIVEEILVEALESMPEEEAARRLAGDAGESTASGTGGAVPVEARASREEDSAPHAQEDAHTDDGAPFAERVAAAAETIAPRAEGGASRTDVAGPPSERGASSAQNPGPARAGGSAGPSMRGVK